jgi:two-component system, LytTR family, response regulator
MPSQAVKTIIVDDEKPSRDALISYIKTYCPDLQIVSECKSVKEAYEAILNHNPQLVFLDIEMPRGSGFDLLKMFKTIEFNVIFITAFSEYATMAFRVAAIDFLLKPVKVSELVDAVKKVQQNIKYKSYQNFNILLENIETPNQPIKKLIIPNQKGFVAVNLSDIIMCEADGYCTNFFLKSNSKISSSHHLKYYEEFLPAYQFLRVHNSFIINLSHVSGYTHLGEIILTDNLRSPLSKMHKNAFQQYYKNRKP